MPTDEQVLRRRINALERTVATLIAWMAASANSPIRPDDATKLLAMLEGDG